MLQGNVHSIAPWVKYVVDAGLVCLFIYRLPDLQELVETRDPHDEEWLLQCRIVVRKFRFFMAAGAFIFSVAAMFISMIADIHAGEKGSMFIVMASPVALVIGLSVGAFCAFFSHQAATFWLINAKLKSLTCVILFAAIVNGWLLN